jgi:hypothetical protein
MKNLIRLLTCLALSALALSHVIAPARSVAATSEGDKGNTAEAKKTTGKKVSAPQLVADSKKALAAMVKSARADKGLDPSTAKNKPFWKSTHQIAQGLKQAEKGLKAKNDDFFKGIGQARTAEAEMKIAWELTDSKNKSVITDGKTLGHTLALLRTNYSKEASRKSKGGELTAQERAAFEKIKAQQKALVVKIKKLEKVAKKDKALEKGLKRIQAQAAHIQKEPATVDAYIATLYLMDEQVGLIRGFDYYVDKSWRADYAVLVDFTTSYETSYTEWETSSSYEWTAVETSVDVYEGEDVEVSDAVSDEEITTEDSYAENESFDMSEAEEEEVAEEEDTDSEMDSDDSSDDDSMEDATDDEGEDMSDSDSGGDEGDDGGGDDGGDDGGE